MSRWLCHLLFPGCKWIHLFNVRNLAEWNGVNITRGVDINLPDEYFGVYQCRRCQDLSIGAPR